MNKLDKEIREVEKWLGGSSVSMFDISLYRTYGKDGKVSWTEAMTKSIEDYRRSKTAELVNK